MGKRGARNKRSRKGRDVLGLKRTIERGSAMDVELPAAAAEAVAAYLAAPSPAGGARLSGSQTCGPEPQARSVAHGMRAGTLTFSFCEPAPQAR